MGEKLLAQRLLLLLHELHGRTSSAAQAVVEWAQQSRGQLWPGDDARPLSDELIGWDSIPTLARDMIVQETDQAGPAVDAVAELLKLPPFDRELLRVTATMQRSRMLASLAARLSCTDADLLATLGTAAGALPTSAAREVRQSQAVVLGLLTIEAERNSVELSWTLSRLLDRAIEEPDRLLDALVGVRQSATLAPEAFVEHGRAFDLLRRLLQGALASGQAGVNILLHGPPGTGKTEFARTLAVAAGAGLLAIGESDEDGEEPTRWERLHALKRAQRMLGGRNDTLLLFDEMEDLFSEASALPGARTGSKLFVNRLFEANAVPIIWTSNALDRVDPAHLRRMSFVLRMDHPSPKARQRIVAAIAAEEGVPQAREALDVLVAAEPEAASVARLALRSARLAGGTPDDAHTAVRSLILGIRGSRELPPAPAGGCLDLDLFESEPPVTHLMDQLSAPGSPQDVSLLLTGPPGTGKTALAAHLARRLDRPLLVKRASDLLSKWIGGTEANIADAFADARDSGSVLLFDEADSLLLDRAGAQHSWEVSQVNELLTWMDGHQLPFIAATNYPQRLDPAVMRRFVFKLRLEPLGEERAAAAFERFFGCPAPTGLRELRGLTPGDFAVVGRQLRFSGNAGPALILRLLEAEARAKPTAVQRIGF